MKVLFLTAGGMKTASSRYRVYELVPYLARLGVRSRVIPATLGSVFEMLVGKSDFVSKAVFFGSLVFGRLRGVLHVPWADVVFIQKLIVPHVYPLPELALVKCARFLGKTVVLDIDDPIYLEYEDVGKSFLIRWSDPDRVKRVARQVDVLVVGNSFLAEALDDAAPSLKVVPTTIDTNRVRRLHFPSHKQCITIGWTGSPATEKYLDLLREPLTALAKRRNITFKIIGAKRFADDRFPVQRIPWKLETEYEEISSFDIGVMPLVDDDEARGKCGFKLLLYMALGVPAVGSPVGVNSEIIEDGYNGFLASSPGEWVEKLELLSSSVELRQKFTANGRKFVEAHYSTYGAAQVLGEIFSVLRRANG